MTEWKIDVRRGRGRMLAEPVTPALGRLTTLWCHGGSSAGALFRLDAGDRWAGGDRWVMVPFEQLRPQNERLLTTGDDEWSQIPTGDVYPVLHQIRRPGIYTCFNDTVEYLASSTIHERTDLIVTTQPVIFELFDDGRAPREITDGSVNSPQVIWARRPRQLYPYPNGSHSNASTTPNPHRYTFEPDRPQE